MHEFTYTIPDSGPSGCILVGGFAAIVVAATMTIIGFEGASAPSLRPTATEAERQAAQEEYESSQSTRRWLFAIGPFLLVGAIAFVVKQPWNGTTGVVKVTDTELTLVGRRTRTIQLTDISYVTWRKVDRHANRTATERMVGAAISNMVGRRYTPNWILIIRPRSGRKMALAGPCFGSRAQEAEQLLARLLSDYS